MKIAIIGTGGVGGYFGGRLANAGYDVTFFARGAHLKAIQTNGLKVKSIKGDFIINPAKATDNIKKIGIVDFIIVAVKAWQIKEIAKELPAIIHSETIVIPMQNGVTAVDELKEYIDQKNIIGGLCRVFSRIDAPGIIEHFGIEPFILFGELDNSTTERIQKIKSVFDKAEITNKIANDITAELWKKFIGICVGGLMAVSKTNYGELRELKETRQLTVKLLTEIYNLSQKMRINIEPDYVSKVMKAIDSYPYESTSSLTRDVWEGKPSEIEEQNGTVVKLAKQHDVETPVNNFIYSCILPMEIKARKR